ncbi:SMODS domain-containing nucleotidyltransferase [Cereibacter johrii]|uniref:SMODS domain-containing nucleotidyltransferase n=1 Tax=Cereibacter johrii TaxID=445629 RepID=UPI003CE96E73
MADNFKSFRKAYLIPTETLSNISYRYRRITRQLNRDFWGTESETSHSLYVGSFGRDTATNGVSDIDMSFTLPASVYHQYNAYSRNGQSTLLQKVKDSINKTYPNSYTGADGQVVALNFADGIKFEILPVFVNADNESFTFADTNGGGSWRVCNPRAEMEYFSIRNSVTANGNLKAICRMTRIWRDKHAVPISGMLIDTLAYQWIPGWEYKDKSFLYHDFLVRDFMKHLSEIDSNKLYWRAPGSGSYVWKGGNFQPKAKLAYEKALDAIKYDTDMPYTAATKWREIFGSKYPTP